MSTSQKQIGDRVRITAGQHKGENGQLVGKERRGWQVELEDGERVAVSFPHVQTVTEEDTQNLPPIEPVNAEVEHSEINADGEITVSFNLDDINRPKTPSETPVSTETTVDAGDAEETDSSDEDTASSAASESAQVDTDGITKLTVKQLQSLAKQRGVAIARTKSDFFRIIKEKNPDEDMERLKGKILFDRVTELHISRLRTKHDLLNLLS